jgi:hypothetical protein
VSSGPNFTAGEIIPNLVVVPVGTDGEVDLEYLNGIPQLEQTTGNTSAACRSSS